MSGKWVQAENGKDEKLDIYVLVDTPDATSTGTAQVLGSERTPQLLNQYGRPLSLCRRFGFDPKDARR